MLLGVAFSAAIISFAATQRNDAGFAWMFRFVINPLFLFSGTFFPLSQLPDWIEWVAAATPLYHGVALVRGAVLNDLGHAGRLAGARRVPGDLRRGLRGRRQSAPASTAGEVDGWTDGGQRATPARTDAHPALVSSLLRARRLVQRNMLVYRHSWIIIVSGFFEPLFYLLGIGYGLGSLTDGVTLSNGSTISYQAFVAPGLLAMSTLNGAIAESIFNVFFKLNFARIYDGILATPLGIREIAIGELIWSLMRGAIYVVAFLIVMLVLGLILSPWAIFVPAAAVLLGAAFSAAGLATTAYLRTVQDFDLPMGLVVMPMFLFSGSSSRSASTRCRSRS